MHRVMIQSLISLIVVGSLTIGLAGTPAIGVATAKGSFRVDHSKVSGNGTLFDGTTVETDQTPSELRLEGGARFKLAPSSRGRVYRDYLLLEKGAGQFQNAGSYQIEARSLRVLAATPNSAARVALDGGNRVLVAALNGEVRVATASGVVVARLAAGKALEFDPKGSGAAVPSKISGCLEEHDGRYVLKDEIAGVTSALLGSNLAQQLRNRVEVTGSMVPAARIAGATQLIQVSNLRLLPGGCFDEDQASGSGSTSGGKASSGAGKAAGAGMSGATKAVIAGVIIAGAATGTAVGLSITGADDKKTVSR